ncbi:serine/threonine-protein kinase [Sorangium sp. So ce1036]|uniref:serine/threonine protein kinase n=1 Tax=Sorangium sp. So ce1036 TaxID=3133328 RepID=UPI003F00AE4F
MGTQRSEIASQRQDPFGWVGTTLDEHFAVAAVAGEGGFGIVYRGLHRGLRVPVAIKCLKLPAHLGAAERERFLKRLRTEARLLHLLSRQTAGIVQALHVGAAIAPSGAWTPYLIMEWLSGETLEQHLARRRRAGAAPMGLAAAAALLAPAAAAISTVHRANVAHLDLKPSNLAMARLGAISRLKVLDFGVARAFAESPVFTASTTETEPTRAFTPQYAAPEQFSPQYGAAGPWTDVFAMALLLIELASGRRALHGDNAMQLFITAIDEQNRASMLAQIPDLGTKAEAVLRRALDVNTQLRFHSMRAFWDALTAALAEEEPARTTPVAPGEGNAPATRPLEPSSGVLDELATVPEHPGADLVTVTGEALSTTLRDIEIRPPAGRRHAARARRAWLWAAAAGLASIVAVTSVRWGFPGQASAAPVEARAPRAEPALKPVLSTAARVALITRIVHSLSEPPDTAPVFPAREVASSAPDVAAGPPPSSPRQQSATRPGANTGRSAATPRVNRWGIQ